MPDIAGADVKASIRSHVTRARLEVEVEGKPHQIGQVFDPVLASVAKHFPGASIGLGTIRPTVPRRRVQRFALRGRYWRLFSLGGVGPPVDVSLKADDGPRVKSATKRPPALLFETTAGK